jgi:hypothetical protein
MDTTPNLQLPYIVPSQAQKHVTHNEALAMLDALVQLAVLDRHLAAPPASPDDGDCFIIANGATGDWTGQAGKVAARQDGDWLFLTPRPGWRAFVIDEALLLYWSGSAWLEVEAHPSELQNMAQLGIGTTADATNPFAAKLNKALWTARPAAEGGDGDLRYTLNKETSADVLSLLFQSGWSGRAEIGLAGDNDLSIKVSADGANWTEIFRGDRLFGEALIGNLRVGRDMLQNVLPDSGRFNGNANNTVFSGIAYTAPTYLSPASGAAFASHAKFVHDNSDYGGGGATLDPEVKALIDKIRPAAARRYGPEWYVIKMTQTAGALTESQLVGGVAHGLIGINANVALPNKFTIGYYVKVKTGSAAIRVNSPRVARAAIEGVAVPAGTGTSPVPLVNADGWKHVNLESTPNQYNYDNTAFQLLASAGSELYLAMPKITFGHANLDPNLGVLMNARMFG